MNLRAWRRTKRLSADDLSSRIGVATSTLISYENGARRPRADVARRIEAVTDGAVSAAYLLGLSEQRAQKRGVREDAATFDEKPTLTLAIPLDEDLARELNAAGADIEGIAKGGALKALRSAQSDAWRNANREAIEAYNAWIAKHGTLAEQLGLI